MSQTGRQERPVADDGHDDPLVAKLTSLGVPVEEAVRLRLAGRAPLAIVERLIVGDTPYSRADLARDAGLDLELLESYHVAAGASGEERFGEADLNEARQLASLLEIFPFEALLRLARLRRIAAGQVALGDVGAIRDELLAPLVRDGVDDVTLADGLANLAGTMWPAAQDITVTAHRRALLRLLRLDVAPHITRSAAREAQLAVGFVDLVGYTRLSAQVDPSGLAEFLRAFEHRVFEVVERAGVTTLAKFMGDAAMLVSTDTLELVEVLVDLVEPVPDLEEAPLRGGVSGGEVTVREGDYFGDPVNVAARLTDAARPWTLLADQTLEDELTGHFELKEIGKLKLSGLGKRRPLLVRGRAGSDEG